MINKLCKRIEAKISREEFKAGWKRLCKLYSSTEGHCLRNGCGQETLAMYANASGEYHSPKFYREVLRIAVLLKYAKEARTEHGYRRYTFPGMPKNPPLQNYNIVLHIRAMTLNMRRAAEDVHIAYDDVKNLWISDVFKGLTVRDCMQEIIVSEEKK